VKAGHPKVLSLDVRYQGGATWMCDPSGRCGAAEVPEKVQPYDTLTIDTSEAARSPSVNGVFFVGTLSAAPPAAGAPQDAPAQP
jgi:hypothetical protein